MTEVEIRGVAAGGDGVGRLGDGMAVFVPRTAPGDRVELEITERRKRWARGRVTSLVQAGEDRIEPLCRHYVDDRCGGCQLQHLQYAAQLAVKARLVGDALRRIGKLDAADPDIVPSPDPWRYRSKITLAAGEGRLGLHRAGEAGQIFDLHDCPITRADLIDLLGVIRTSSLLPESTESVVVKADGEGGRHVIVKHGGDHGLGAVPETLAAAATVWEHTPGAPDPVFVAGVPSELPPLAFEQIHTALGDRVRHDAVAALDLNAGDVAWDLYGGAGDTGVMLADRGARVWSVESNPRQSAWAEARRSRTGLTFVAGMVEDALPALPPPDVIVLNPPRAGLSRQARRLLGRLGGGARSVAYVSCDPATLARDLAAFEGFGLASVRAYDLFPQTSHVETLLTLRVTP